MKKKNFYPRLKEIGVKVYLEPIAHVKTVELNEGLNRTGLSIDKFNQFFGCQTCPVVDGVGETYPWDVESVLERMMSGRLSGTQLFWD